MVGVGKSYLARLLYQDVENRRRRGGKQFAGESIWYRFSFDATTSNLSFTIANLARILSKDLGISLPKDFDNQYPTNQALEFFATLNKIEKPRLVILDQFDNLLDWQTGQALDKCSGLGRWLDELHSQPCRCRFLFTSGLYPQGTKVPFSSHVKEYQVKNLEVIEGVELLQNQKVEAQEEELRKAVVQCDGHAHALTILASLLHRNPVQSLSTFFSESENVQRWQAGIANKCLGNIDER